MTAQNSLVCCSAKAGSGNHNLEDAAWKIKSTDQAFQNGINF